MPRLPSCDPKATHAASADGPDAARIWLLLSERIGETQQQRALATALGERYAERRISGDRLLDEPGPPWPRLAIAFGKGLAAAKRLRRASGGTTRIVLLGRPRHTPIAAIDLILPMPQDRLPAAPNVLSLDMPLANPATRRPEAACADPPAWADLPRPWIALLVGGATKHDRFDAGAATRLGQAASAAVRANGGSLLVTTSRRTGTAATEALRVALAAPNYFHGYVAGDPDNPLPAWLDQADGYIVTADSGSMLAEAWHTGRPVHVAAVAPQRGLRPRLKRAARALLPGAAHAALIRSGLVAAPVDLAGWVEARIADGHFGRLGGPQPWRRPGASADNLAPVLARIRALLGDP